MTIGDRLYQDATRAYAVTDRTATFGLTTLNSGVDNQRYYPFVANETTFQYEVGGPKNGQLVSTTSSVNTFDSYGNATNVSTAVTDNDVGSPYNGLAWTTTTATTVPIPAAALSNWCLNMPTAIQVTRAAPGTTAVTRTATFTPDYVKCRETGKIAEPLSAAYKVTTSYQFDSFGNISSETLTGIGMGAASPASRVTLTDRGLDGIFPMTITDPSGAVTKYTYDLNFGVPLTMTDRNNLVTTWEYADQFGRKTRELRPDGTSTTWVYADCPVFGCLANISGLDLQETIYNADSTVQATNTSFFDMDSRLVLSQNQALQPGTYNRIEVAYDTFGKVARQYAPCVWQGVNTACPYSSVTRYDLRNRPYQIERPVSQSNGALQTTLISYQGDTTIATDPLTIQSKVVSTPIGQVGQSIDVYGYAVSRTFDGFGSLVGVTDSQSNTLFTASYDYGIAPFQRDATDMDLDTSTAAGQHRHYNYSALGELTSWTDAKGQSFSMTYDASSRPLTRTEPDGVSTWFYGASPASHNVGQLQCVLGFSGANCAATGVGYKASYVYDALARPQTVTYTTDTTYQVDYAYNTQGKLDTFTYPTSTAGYRLALKYIYQNGMLKQVKDANATTVFWQANSINAFGEVTQFALGNGIVANRAYDAVTGWLTSIQAGVGGGTTTQNEAYSYDLMGNVALRQNINAGQAESLCYDGRYRLDHTTSTTVCGSPASLQMSYDAMGNIVNRTDLASGLTPWMYHPTKKHAALQAGNSSYAYDANGNSATRNGQPVTWTSYNYPSVINDIGKSVSFSYDPNRLRYKQIYVNPTANETTMYVGGFLDKVTVGTTVVWRHYIRVGNSLVAIMTRPSVGSNATWYVLEDHQGSIAKILDSAGATYVSESFSPFGTRRDPTNWSSTTPCPDLGAIAGITRIGYTGQEAVGGVSMGLNHMNGRVQDAFTGRFLSADHYISNQYNNQSYNRYSYVNNNPVTFTDPSGFLDEIFVYGPDLSDIPQLYLSGGWGSTSSPALRGPIPSKSSKARAQSPTQPCYATYGLDKNGNPLPEAPAEPVYPELLLAGVERLLYAGLAKLIPGIATSLPETAIGQAAYASAARNSLKEATRFPLNRLFPAEPPFSDILGKYGGDANAIIDAASRTNMGYNTAGAAAAAIGANSFGVTCAGKK
jgi:RHS repeat-associated protein